MASWQTGKRFTNTASLQHLQHHWPCPVPGITTRIDRSPQIIGEFHEIDDVEVVKEARKAKSKSQTQGTVQATSRAVKVEKVWGYQKAQATADIQYQKSITVELELANVNEIDGREHGKMKTRKTA